MISRKHCRRIVDLCMTLLLPLLMGYSLIGETLHEWIGVSIFLLFLVHQYLNLGWWKALFKGKYTARRVFQTVLNLLLLLIMLAQPISGLMMSKHIFTFLTLETSTARLVHLCLSNWGFVLMSLHIGTHMDMMLKPKRRTTSAKAALGVLGAVLLIYGSYAFWKRGLLSYMLLQNQFAFFDFSESRIVFLLDYGCVHWCPKYATHPASRMLKNRSQYHHPEVALQDLMTKQN